MRPHGLRGTLRLKPLTRSVEELLDAPVDSYHVRLGRRLLGPFKVEELWVSGSTVHARFEGIQDRTAAEELTTGELVVPPEQLWPAPPDSFYIHDLEGLEVLDADSGTRLGTVRTAREGTAHDYLVLDLEAAPGQEVLLPLLPQFVLELDPARRVATVRIPEGLVD
jgi:16S rRNA processing protein RimM